MDHQKSVMHVKEIINVLKMHFVVYNKLVYVIHSIHPVLTRQCVMQVSYLHKITDQCSPLTLNLTIKILTHKLLHQ